MYFFLNLIFFFSEEQRKAVIEAASATGLKVKSLIAEPVAAAMAYSMSLVPP